jgi:phage repressor protein C with HTH and peptisase S24 domain
VSNERDGEWLRKERQQRGWSAADLAARVREVALASGEELSLTQQAVSRFEVGDLKSVPRWVTQYAAAIFNAVESPAAANHQQALARRLFEQASQDQLVQIAGILAGTADIEDLAAEQLDLVGIQQIDLAYGMGATFADGPVEVELLRFPKAWVQSITSSPPQMLTWASGRGDSMAPTIHDGDIVLLDRSQRRVIEQDALWAYTVGDLGAIKRLRIKGNRVVILSDNPAVPPDEEPIDEVNIVARVIFIGKRT